MGGQYIDQQHLDRVIGDQSIILFLQQLTLPTEKLELKMLFSLVRTNEI